MTEGQYINVMWIIGFGQVLAITAMAAVSFIPRLSKSSKEGLFIIWMVFTILMPYLDTGMSVVFRGALFIFIVTNGCLIAKHFYRSRYTIPFYIQLYITYIGACGLILEYLHRFKG